MDELMGFFAVVVIFLGGIMGTSIVYKSCSETDSKIMLEKQKLCFESTKDKNCFWQLKESK